ncbi:MAG: FIST C-terminal domain-containing protein [Desulfonatronovibrionaceae bacterium]
MSHPEKVFPDHSISLFTDIKDNDRITLMSGSRKSLVSRPTRVVESVLANNDYQPEQIQGALIDFCAGSMLAVRKDLNEVKRQLNALLGDVPYLTIFTFGEQGSLTKGANYHGNLMVSVILFSNRPSAI